MQDERIKAITDKAKEMKDLDIEIEKLREALAVKEKNFNYISEVELPEMMGDIGLSQFVLTDGTKLSVSPVLKVSVPKYKMNDANKWLVENQYDGMVKTSLEFPRSVPDYAINQIIQFILSQGYYCETERKIHWQTLNKWAREMELEGEVIPEDIFNVFRSNKTVIERK